MGINQFPISAVAPAGTGLSSTLDEWTNTSQALGVVSRTKNIPIGVCQVYGSMTGTVAVGGYTYPFTANTPTRIVNKATSSSYSVTMNPSTSGFQWQPNSSGGTISVGAYTSGNNPDPGTGVNRKSIAFGNGIFVIIPSATGAGGTAYVTTTDGTTFTTRTLPAAAQYVTYAGTLFFAYPEGATTYFLTSTDGINWTSRTVTSGHYTAPVKTSTNYVAVKSPISNSDASTYNTSIVSSDGFTWTAGGVTGTTQSWMTSATNGGTVVAFAYYSASMATGNPAVNMASSTNGGVSWTARAVPAANYVSVFWTGSNFMAVSTSSTTYLTSPDGATWTTRTVGAANGLTQYNQPKWSGSNGSSTVTFGYFGATGAVSYTTDGLNFTTCSQPSNAILGLYTNMNNIAYGNNIHLGGDFYAASAKTTTPATSNFTPASFGIYAGPPENV